MIELFLYLLGSFETQHPTTKLWICLLEEGLRLQLTEDLNIKELLCGYETTTTMKIVDQCLGIVPPLLLYYTVLYLDSALFGDHKRKTLSILRKPTEKSEFFIKWKIMEIVDYREM